ncbi:cGMP-specific 3',5'-cyclic phosphodiesterase-like isoform X1 [Amphiura filiformis]|uniref:cGMP-specific 3',5'-cyclic phosphodiesterase-like isoform X1 n=1 Tax=Amphiura filiformis TaxID=82378 RepID=UPI003B215ECB
MDSNKMNRNDVEKWLESHPEDATNIFTAKATPDMVDQWLAKRSSRKSLQDIGWASESSPTAVHPGERGTHHMLQSFRNVRKSFAGASGSLRSLLSPRKRKLHRRNKSALRQLDEKELFMELIRDIADELDLNTLSHKILSNVSILTNADRCSLFLVRHVRGDKEERVLVSKLFDVTENSTVEDALHSEEEEIKIPFGQGIAGHVALTKETVNIKNAYEDPRFNPEIDKKTGFRTHSILCMPICSHDGEVVGVAQVINKITGSHEFTQKDEEVFRNYLTFCGIGIMNAQLFEMSVNEYKRNQMLLQLARGIFAEQTSLDSVVHKIMSEAIELMKCKRCLVFILEEHEMSRLRRLEQCCLEGTTKIIGKRDTPPSLSRENSDNRDHSKRPTKQPSEETLKSIGFLKAFDLSNSDKDKVRDAGFEILHRSVNSDMAKYVAATGETINISEFDAQTRFKPVYDIDKEFKIRPLCASLYTTVNIRLLVWLRCLISSAIKHQLGKISQNRMKNSLRHLPYSVVWVSTTPRCMKMQ